MTGKVGAVVCLGCLIRGATPHFEYIASACAHGITAAAASTGVPMSFGVLTTNSAEEALESGLINRVFTRDDFDFQAKDFLKKLTSKSGAILKLGKEALQKAEDLALGESLEMLEKYLESVMATNDSKEGFKAFIEKRQPQWKDA